MDANQDKQDERKVRFQVLSNVLSETSLRVPLKVSLTVADASKEILNRICQSMNIALDQAKMSSLSVCLESGRRDVLFADDTLNDSIDVVTEKTLYAEVLVGSSAAAAAAAVVVMKPTQTELEEDAVASSPPVEVGSAAAAVTPTARKSRTEVLRPSFSSSSSPAAAASSSSSAAALIGALRVDVTDAINDDLRDQREVNEEVDESPLATLIDYQKVTDPPSPSNPHPL